jgi:hypothetical protein
MSWMYTRQGESHARATIQVRNVAEGHSLSIEHWIGNCCGANSVSSFYYLPKTPDKVTVLIEYMKTQPWCIDRGQYAMKHFFGWAKKSQVNGNPAFFNHPNITLLHEFPNGAHGPELLVAFMLDLSK